MARRILNRRELRADFDAAERRKPEDEEGEEGEGEEEEGEEEEAAAGEEGEEDEEEAEEEAPAPKKRKAPAKEPKAKAKPRSRAPKIVRMKVVWGVFNNSNQRVATFDYSRRKEADEKAAQLTADKKSTHFVQPIKEPIEEKKE